MSTDTDKLKELLERAPEAHKEMEAAKAKAPELLQKYVALLEKEVDKDIDRIEVLEAELKAKDDEIKRLRTGIDLLLELHDDEQFLSVETMQRVEEFTGTEDRYIGTGCLMSRVWNDLRTALKKAGE